MAGTRSTALIRSSGKRCSVFMSICSGENPCADELGAGAEHRDGADVVARVSRLDAGLDLVGGHLRDLGVLVELDAEARRREVGEQPVSVAGGLIVAADLSR
jgi:hypothetical protein